MPPDEKAKMTLAAFAVTELFPNAIGELVARELQWWANLGYQLDQSGLARRVVAAVEDEQRKRRQAADEHAAEVARRAFRGPHVAVGRASCPHGTTTGAAP
jgi:hypothetical protein